MSLRESESWAQFLVISVDFCQLRIKYHVIRASAETCYECLRGENKQKLEVLSFEKAWDKIEKDIQNFIRRDPYKQGQTPLNQQKISKGKHYC